MPLGKLNSERSVPLHPAAEAALEEWCVHRGQQRAIPHSRNGRSTDFVFMEGGRRLRARAIQQGLAGAVLLAGLTTADDAPLRVVATSSGTPMRPSS
jgi:site-specific recombinase XerC